MKGIRHRDRVLAVYPFTRGIAFTLFEAPLSPLDWGVKDIRGKQKNALTLEAAKKLIEIHQPDVLVLQDVSAPGSRRAERIRRLHRLIASHANGQAIEVYRYSRKQVKAYFKPSGAITRYEIAQVIAAQIHAFGHRLPSVRKIWEAEDSRMSLFDAASLALTFYSEQPLEENLLDDQADPLHS